MSMLRYQNAVLVSLLIWLLVSWSGACGHFCFDGNNPPLSIHSVNTTLLDHHVDDCHDTAPNIASDITSDIASIGNPQHIDIEVDLSQWLSVKLLKTDLPVLLALVFLFVTLLLARQIFAGFYSFTLSSHHTGLRPPLRGPPAFPA